MRNMTSRLAIAAVLTAGMAAPALADVDVTVLVSKDKTITVNESLSKDVTVTITLDVDVDLDRAAEAIALVNQTAAGNVVDRDIDTPAASDGESVVRTALIGDAAGGSVSGNQGVTGVNQDVGVMTNQGNIWSVAVSEDSDTPPAANVSPDTFVDAQAEVDQLTTGNAVDWTPLVPAPPGPTGVLVTANIEDSIIANRGLTAVNQNAGNMNNQSNAVAVAAGLFQGSISSTNFPPCSPACFDGATVAMAEAALGQETTGNTVAEGPNDLDLKLATMLRSVQNNIGVTQVNQDTGNMGNQGNVTAVGAAILTPLVVPVAPPQI